MYTLFETRTTRNWPNPSTTNPHQSACERRARLQVVVVGYQEVEEVVEGTLMPMRWTWWEIQLLAKKTTGSLDRDQNHEVVATADELL